MSRLIVISNRVGNPRAINAGGLATALLSALREKGGLWLGWSGEIAKTDDPPPLRMKARGKVQFATFDLTRKDYETYYSGFSNRTLWPLLHYRPDLIDFHRETYAGYQRVNELFARHALELVRDDDTIWIHDYHLIPLAWHLRKLGVCNRIGFFLHIPLAAAELLRMLPCHRELISSLLAYDLVGLQTENDLRALQEYFQRILNARVRSNGWIQMPNGLGLQADAFPISIDTEAITHYADAAATLPALTRLHDSLNNRALILGVDRLDYSKGLLSRFEAFGKLLENHRDLHGRVTMLQIAPPSRNEVPEYQHIRAELERAAGHINGLYATPDWAPIRYVNRSFPQQLLAGYYRAAQVALVTPLRDGMNLVAKEYVACQNPENPGVLVLSQFAGAARELKPALLVNPFDQDEIADAMAAALEMPLSERRVRWRRMMGYLRHHDIAKWRGAFLQRLAEQNPFTMQRLHRYP